MSAIRPSIEIVYNRPCFLVGSFEELERKKKDFSFIPDIVKANLTTNQAQVKSFTSAVEPINTQPLKDQIKLLSLYREQSSDASVASFSKIAMAFVATLVSACVSFLFFSQAGGVLIGFVGLSCVILSSSYLAKEAIKFMSFRGLYVLKYETKEKNLPSKTIEQVSNQASVYITKENQEKESVQDPISFDDINKEWMSAPRFVSVGNYLFALDSLLQCLFNKPLNCGIIRHPLENRGLGVAEQEQFLSSLSDLFCISSKQILDCWFPYSNKTQETGWFAEDRLVEEELTQRARNRGIYSGYFGVWIQGDVRSDFLKDKRLRVFLEQFDDEILDLEIKKTEEESFTLRDLLDTLKEKKYKCRLRYQGQDILV